MTSQNDLLGSRGETAFAAEMLRPIAHGGGMATLFEPIKLGEKTEGFDFLVIARTSNLLLQPSFFVQIKTTENSPANGRIAVRCSAPSIKRLQATRLPVYLVAVSARQGARERLYITGITMSRTMGISRVGVKHSLSSNATKLALWNEVVSFFTASMAGPAISIF